MIKKLSVKDFQKLLQIPDEELTEEERINRLYNFLAYLEDLRQEQERSKKKINENR